MFWYDGILHENNSINISITSPSLLYGATVFSTMRLYQGSLNHPLTQWPAHCSRINSSIKLFGWSEPDWSDLKKGAQILGQNYPILRLTIFPEGQSLITGRNLPLDLDMIQQKGIKGFVAKDRIYQRAIGEHKTGNYLGPWLAKSQGYREAILINRLGQWLETSSGNLWGYCNGTFYTPPLDGDVLPGIARNYLLSCLQANKINYQEIVWDLALINKLEMIGYSNSVVEIVPFETIVNDGQVLTFEPQHPAYSLLRQYYQY